MVRNNLPNRFVEIVVRAHNIALPKWEWTEFYFPHFGSDETLQMVFLSGL